SSTVTFISSDASIVSVDTTSAVVDGDNGYAVRTITAMSAGSAIITATTENGLTVTFPVKVEIPGEEEIIATVTDVPQATPDDDTENVKTVKNPMMIKIIIAIMLLAVGALILLNKKTVDK
ncbi:MAG: hypothetical protein WBI07_11665, partial [Mobilitalea sp.]